MERARAAAQALLGAALFGASVPLAKRLVPQIETFALAGLLYLGAGLALSLLSLVRRGAREARLRPSDVPALAGVVLAGGALGPLLLLLGLRRTSGMAASLLLNLEAPLTALLAAALFGEHLGRRAAAALALTVGASALLAAQPGPWRANAAGALLLAGACACWALDNNLTTRLSLRDPVALVRLKGLLGGAGTLLLALAAGERLPPLQPLAAALLLGAIGYGASIVLCVRAMRQLGAARQAGLFATAPFAGLLASMPLLGERPGARELCAAALMAAGVFLLLRERHAHRHAHAPAQHDHLHVHDEHHQHAHRGDEGPEPHSHLHRHEAIEHEHPHLPDAHHRHTH